MRTNRGVLAGVLLMSSLAAAPANAQTASRLGPSITAISAFVKGSAVAYDPKNSKYLVVSAYGDLNGRFVSADGELLGNPFTIQAGAVGFAHFPGVAYSPDANGGAGGFLVAWHQSVAVGAVVYARTVSTTGALGPAAQLTGDGSWWEAMVDVAYSTVSKEFFVVWQAAGIRAQRVSTAGGLLGANIFVTGTNYHRDPSVAYNPVANEFMVVYAGDDGVSPFVGARRVAAGSGALVGTQTLLSRAVGTYITEVAYNSSSNTYLAAWYQGGTYGRILDASGNAATGVLLLATRFSAYDALGIDYNATSGTYMMVSHDTASLQDGAVEVSAGAIPGLGVVATDAPTTKGNYYPKIAARAGKAEWLMSTATSFAATTVQRLQTGGSSPAPPPPPPPCVATPSVTTVSLLNTAATFPINVTAPSTCAWTATSGTSWLQISSGGSGTGNSSVGITALRNTSATVRTGTLTIAGTTIPVQQAGFNAAAVHDLNADGMSDLVWQSQTTGALAVWTMRENSLISTQAITPSVSDTAWRVAGTGDLNGDGFADLVWQKTDGEVAAWYLRGPTVINTAYLSIRNVGPSWKIRGVGDVNGDGKADILWQHDQGWLAVWLMNGVTATSTLTLSVPRMPDLNWKIVGAGDINGDRRADIVWQNQATGGLGAWLLSDATVIRQQNLSTSVVSDLNWTIRGVGDTNGDGYADLLWQNAATGGVAMWFLNGFTVINGVRVYDATSPLVVDTNWTLVGPG